MNRQIVMTPSMALGLPHAKRDSVGKIVIKEEEKFNYEEANYFDD